MGYLDLLSDQRIIPKDPDAPRVDAVTDGRYC
jgi:hypothetical protein